MKKIVVFLLMVIILLPIYGQAFGEGKNLDHYNYEEWSEFSYTEKVRYIQGYIVGMLGLTYRLERDFDLENSLEVVHDAFIYHSAETMVEKVNKIYMLQENRNKPIWYVLANHNLLKKGEW